MIDECGNCGAEGTAHKIGKEYQEASDKYTTTYQTYQCEVCGIVTQRVAGLVANDDPSKGMMMSNLHVNMAEVINLLHKITELCRLDSDARLDCAEFSIDEDGSWDVTVEYRHSDPGDSVFFYEHGQQESLGDLVNILHENVERLTRVK